MITAESLSKKFAGTAREHYEADGYVAPVLFLLDEVGDGLALLPPDGHPTDAFAAMTYFLAPGFYGHLAYVVAVTEAWVKSVQPGEDELPPIEGFHRGDLQKAHEALDMTVRTCVICLVLDMKAGEDGTVMTHSTNIGLDQPEWDIATYTGRTEGALSELLWRASHSDPPVPPPPGVGLKVWAALATSTGLVDSAMLMEGFQ